jgi:hypothetical protein
MPVHIWGIIIYVFVCRAAIVGIAEWRDHHRE